MAGTIENPETGYVTYNNYYPYITEIKKMASDPINPERNIFAVWEQRDGNKINIKYAGRNMTNGVACWGTDNDQTITLDNVPSDFKCFPKVFEARESAGSPHEFRVTTYLNYVSTNENKLLYQAKFWAYHTYNPVTLVQPPAGTKIEEYAVAGIYSGSNWHLHVVYRIGQSLFYAKFIVYTDLSHSQEGPTVQLTGAGDISRYRASLDIAVKKANDGTIQPVVTYQGKYNVVIMINNQDGPPIEVPGTYYPIYVRERLSGGLWSTSNIIYNSLNTVQSLPNIVGSYPNNSCLLNYGHGNSFYQAVPRWNGGEPNHYHCYPNTFTGKDSRIAAGEIDNFHTNRYLYTLTQNVQISDVYDIGKRSFNVSTNGGLDDFTDLTGTVTNNTNVYSFNLGNIMVNWNLIGFDTDIDTAISGVPDLNNGLKSKNFQLHDNDTLVIGRNASYIVGDSASQFQEVEYWVKLMNNSSGQMHMMLAHDTVHVYDTIQVEYLEGFVVNNIPNGVDSFYVQMEVDTIDGTGGIGGGVGGDGSGGDSPGMRKYIFWGGKNHSSISKVNSQIPTVFALYQNYPNPFNPATKIKYDLPKNTNVTIKIYDILGREVTTLVRNEFKQAGRYEVSWNANNYASGVYFYRIEAGSFVSAKKMVLIK